MSRIPRRLQKQIEELEPTTRAAFLEAIEDIRSEAELLRVAEALERRDLEEAYRLLSLNPAFFARLDRAVAEAFYQAGVTAAGGLPLLRDPVTLAKVSVRFDVRNPRAEAWSRNRAGALIQGIIEDQKESVRAMLEEGIALGRNPRTTALQIIGRVNAVTRRREGGILGLNAAQANAVIRARAELAAGDFDRFLTRKRRDARFDPMIRKAAASGKPLAATDIERVLGRYSDRLLQLRGETIARTETLAALQAGKMEGLAQAIESGKIEASQVTLVWRSTGDTRTRDSHQKMDKQRVPYGQPFVTPSGYQMKHPHDTSLGAPASETIACRCYLETKIDFLARFR